MLKMDIEWDEWSVLDNIKRATLQNFNQLLIELHLVHIDTNNNFMLSNEKLTPYFKNFYLDAYHGMNEYIFDLYYKVLHKLRRDFHIFHISANNSLQKVDFADCTFPPLIELSLVRKDIVNNAKSTKCKFPVDGLDYPNKPWRDEIIDFYPVA